jgi:radical SAM protein with 4Fe4S-binding SPASM domain
MVVDDEAMSLIHLSDGSRDLSTVAKEIAKETGRLEGDVLTEGRSVLKQLERSGVAYKKSPKDGRSSRKPKIENVTVNVTQRCNLRCAHCFLDGGTDVEESLDIGDLTRFLEQGRRYIAKNVNFAILGGEPLMAKDKTLAVAELAKMWGGEATVSTNGILIDHEFAKRAKDRDLLVQVSLEGSTPAVNDPVRGKGSFRRAVDGVRVLVECGTHSILSMVVQEGNFDDIEAFYDLSLDLGTDEVRFIPLNMMGRARNTGLRTVPNVQLVRRLGRLMRDRPEAKDRMTRDYFTILMSVCSLSNRRPYCGTGLKTMLIDADGEVYPCPNHQFPEFQCGNIHDATFKEVWLGSPVLKRVRSIYDLGSINDECSNCPLRHWCMGGCRGETYENTGDMTATSVRCEDLRSAVIEMMWTLGSSDVSSAVTEKTEYF